MPITNDGDAERRKVLKELRELGHDAMDVQRPGSFAQDYKFSLDAARRVVKLERLARAVEAFDFTSEEEFVPQDVEPDDDVVIHRPARIVQQLVDAAYEAGA